MTETNESYAERENMWDEQWPVTDESARDHPALEPDNLDEELPFPETVGTPDVIESVRDAEPYVPPTDPPVLPGGTEGIHVATGFGVSAEEEAVHDPAPRGDDDIRRQALLLLGQDSLTSTSALDVEVNDATIRLVGPVDSIDVAEHATWILGELPGVVDVVDDTTLT